MAKLPKAWVQGKPPVLSSPAGVTSKPQPMVQKVAQPEKGGGPGNTSGPTQGPASVPKPKLPGLPSGGPGNPPPMAT